MPEEKTDSNLPAVREPSRLSYMTQGVAPAAEPVEASVPLSHYLWILRRHRWRILAFVFTVVVATAVVSSRLTPIYEATATVDIDRQTPPGVLGQDSLRSPMNDADQFLATQIKLIQSDSVLRPVAHKYNLLTLEKDSSEAPQAGTPGEDAPVLLKQLRVTRPPNTYLLLISYRSPDPRLAAEVSNATAQSYLEHTYDIRYRSSASLSSFMEKQLEELKAKMERSSAALVEFEKELNVINPEEKTSILSARLLQLNTEYTTAQADRVRKEAASQSVKDGSLEAAQVSTQGESLRKLAERLDEAQQKFADVKTHYGPSHPEFKKADAQFREVQRELQQASANIAQRVQVEYREAISREHMLQNAVAETKADFDRLNARSFEYQSLKREAEADRKLYEELLQKIKEAGINASFQNSAIRIADLARPPVKPVFPNLELNVLLAFLLSTLFAVGGAVLSDVLDNTLRDPEQVARTLQAQVVGTLPMVKDLRGRMIGAKGSANALVPSNGASEHVVDSFGEAIRTLRNSILLTDFDRSLRSLLVTSASPGEGKSTMAINLAIAHAQQRQKTLLIDGDLRRPSIHRQLRISGALGLSSVLSSESVSWKEAVVKLDAVPGMDVLPAGPPSRRAADLIGRGLLQIIEEASLEYDLIVLDAPPLLGFPEPLEMATVVDGVIVITRAGQTNRKAVSSVLNTLHRLRANVVGLVLNEVHKELSDSYHYYGYYGKYYKPAARS
jgi:capsular exopolysaccharide synthesis family protein